METAPFKLIIRQDGPQKTNAPQTLVEKDPYSTFVLYNLFSGIVEIYSVYTRFFNMAV
jgi:hypothetical protein